MNCELCTCQREKPLFSLSQSSQFHGVEILHHVLHEPGDILDNSTDCHELSCIYNHLLSYLGQNCTGNESCLELTEV